MPTPPAGPPSPRAHLRRPRLLATATATVAVALLAGCGSGGTSGNDSATLPSVTTRTPGSSAPAPGATSTATPTSVGGTQPLIARFDLPATVTCTAGTTTVTASYTTVNVETVAFAVDGRQAGTAPPSGTFDVPIPCDGTIHTVLLVAVGPSGQVVATKAVGTSTGG